MRSRLLNHTPPRKQIAKKVDTRSRPMIKRELAVGAEIVITSHTITGTLLVAHHRVGLGRDTTRGRGGGTRNTETVSPSPPGLTPGGLIAGVHRVIVTLTAKGQSTHIVIGTTHIAHTALKGLNATPGLILHIITGRDCTLTNLVVRELKRT